MGGSWEPLITVFWGTPASCLDPAEPGISRELVKLSTAGACRALVPSGSPERAGGLSKGTQHSSKAGSLAGSLLRRRLESGACQGEGKERACGLPGREIPHVRQSRHRRGRRPPESPRAVLHDLIWLSPQRSAWCLNQYSLAGPEAPRSSCRAPPGRPSLAAHRPTTRPTLQAGSQGRSRAAGDWEALKGLRPALAQPQGCALCQWEEAVSVQIQTPFHLLPAGQHTRPPWGSGAHTSRG